MSPPLNKPYIAFVASVGTIGLAFIGWTITAQVYREWSQGLAISGGWNWPTVIGVDILCMLCAAALYWKIYADPKTTIDASGVSRPCLYGPTHIAWPNVTDIKAFGGTGFHIYAGKAKIVISPYAYREPEAVIEAIKSYSVIARNGHAA